MAGRQQWPKCAKCGKKHKNPCGNSKSRKGKRKNPSSERFTDDDLDIDPTNAWRTPCPGCGGSANWKPAGQTGHEGGLMDEFKCGHGCGTTMDVQHKVTGLTFDVPDTALDFGVDNGLQ